MEKEFYVHLFHIILVSGLFYYIGTTGDKLPKNMFPFLIGLGIFIIAYHIYKSLFKKDAWVNYIHILIVGPILVWIGLCQDKTHRKFFEIILMLAFASFGYHLYYLVQ
jgi:NADH:ubiquinone oxidoreductase subunit K